MRPPASPPLEPIVLCTGLAFAATLAGHVILDRMITPFGPLSLAGALAAAVCAGLPAAGLLRRWIDPPDMGGGGVALALVAVAGIVAALTVRVAPMPEPYWSTVWDVVRYRAAFAPALVVAALPGVLLPMHLGPDEVFEDGRFRRAAGYWLSAWAPPAIAWLLLMPRGVGMVYWFVVLVMPLLLFLGALGVRLREEAFHHRGARARLAAVSVLATALLVALGTVRQVAA